MAAKPDEVARDPFEQPAPEKAEAPQHSLSLPGHLSVVRRLGAGAYGDVYLCHDDTTDKHVAVKVVRDFTQDLLFGKRILREIRILASMRHENLMRLLDVLPVPGLDFSDVYIVMPYMHADLHRIIYSKMRLAESHCQAFTCQILRGLTYLHSAGVVHRDLKPPNVLVNRDCTLRITDFGLARGRCNKEEVLTDYVVTRWYRAPELLLLPQGYFEAVDLWAVGCIHFELLAREPLFPGKDHCEMLRCIAGAFGFVAERDMAWIPESDRAGVQTMLDTLRLREQPEREIKDRIPTASSSCLDLLHALLERVPARRISARDALEHPYLGKLRDPMGETLAKRQFAWDFDHFEPSKRALKDRIYAECARLHPEIIARDTQQLKRRGFETEGRPATLASCAAG